MPLRCRLIWTFVAAAIVGATTLTTAEAQTQPPLSIKSVRAGVGGRCKAGFWAPVWLTLQAGPDGAAGALELVAEDGDNVPVIYSQGNAATIQLSAGQATSRLLYAKIGPVNTALRAQLRKEDSVIWSEELSGLPPRLDATNEVVVTIGPDIGGSKAASSIRRPAELAMVHLHVQDPSDLPDQWWGYEGVDLVIMPTSDAANLDQWGEKQRNALAEWVRLGGKLIVSMGAGGERLLTEGGDWQWLAPGKLQETSPLRERAGLEAFSGNPLALDAGELARNRPLVTRLSNVDGAIIVDEVGVGSARPLVIRSTHGLGEVTFVGLDLDHPGLAAWNGRTRLLANLLQSPRATNDRTENEVSRRVTHLGYEDLVGQLRAGLDQFQGVTLVNFTTVSLLVVSFLLLVGPIDFLVLSRLRLARHLTWLTFPAVIIAFCVLAGYVQREAHGTRARLNQVEIVDIDSRLGAVRGTVWAHLYSPETRSFEVTAAVRPASLPIRESASGLSWQGLPGDSLGGLGARQIALSSAEPYRAVLPGHHAELSAVPLQTASSKSLSGRWWSTLRRPIDLRLERDQYGLLRGELRNPLDVALTECLVAYEERLYRLGSLPPEQSVLLEQLSPLNLEARLTQRTVVRAQDISTPWQQDSTDVPLIVRMLMFHEAAGGKNYTGLTHRYQPYVDLSEAIKTGRAVFVGRLDEPVTSLSQNNHLLAAPADQQVWTWVRILIPVTLAAEEQP